MELLVGVDNMEMMIWNVILTVVVGVLGSMFKSKFEELERLGILLNRTREEIARNHITREEVHRDLERIMDRFDEGIHRLEAKIDEINRYRNA